MSKFKDKCMQGPPYSVSYKGIVTHAVYSRFSKDFACR